MRILTTVLVPAFLFLAACGASTTAPAGAGHAVVDVTDAFIVQPPEGRDVTGGGMHVSVKGGSLTLVGATSEIAQNIEMHTMSMEDGVMQMRKVDGFTVSDEQPLVLERGGNHLMFFGTGPLEAGQTVSIVLTFSDDAGTRQEVPVTAEVVPTGG
jgi:copper(I)-binding protein